MMMVVCGEGLVFCVGLMVVVSVLSVVMMRRCGVFILDWLL